MRRMLLGIVLGIALVMFLTRRGLAFGVVILDRKHLEHQRGKPLDLIAVGVLEMADDVTPEMATRSIRALRVVGLFQAGKPVRDALADKVTVVGTIVDSQG